MSKGFADIDGKSPSEPTKIYKPLALLPLMSVNLVTARLCICREIIQKSNS